VLAHRISGGITIHQAARFRSPRHLKFVHFTVYYLMHSALSDAPLLNFFHHAQVFGMRGCHLELLDGNRAEPIPALVKRSAWTSESAALGYHST